MTYIHISKKQSNGEYVDYVRMGYGKSKEHVIHPSIRQELKYLGSV